MSRYTGNRSSGSGGPNPIWAGIFVGMVIGAGMAAVVTWYMMRSPSPFLKEKPVAEAMKLVPLATGADAHDGQSHEKPRFEFYNVLTDKQGQKSATLAKPAMPEKPPAQIKPEDNKVAESKPTTAYAPQILQVGSFSTNGDAEKLKAKLAMIGAESHIQMANVPGRGVYYRVRLGPYKSEEEMNRARNFLKQNDLESTPMRAQ